MPPRAPGPAWPRALVKSMPALAFGRGLGGLDRIRGPPSPLHGPPSRHQDVGGSLLGACMVHVSVPVLSVPVSVQAFSVPVFTGYRSRDHRSRPLCSRYPSRYPSFFCLRYPSFRTCLGASLLATVSVPVLVPVFSVHQRLREVPLAARALRRLAEVGFYCLDQCPSRGYKATRAWEFSRRCETIYVLTYCALISA